MSENGTNKNLFRFKVSVTGTLRARLLERFSNALNHAVAIPALEAKYRVMQRQEGDRPFSEVALDVLEVAYEVSAEDLANIPTEGPVVAVANHPFGMVEGLVIDSLMKRVRPDVKTMANSILSVIPELRDSLIYVDPFGTATAARDNLQPIRESIRWLRQGGMLGIFPAGEVAHLDLKRRGVIDPPWNTTVARLIPRSRATVVPIFICGTNGKLFQLLGLLHPRVRTALLVRELLNKRRLTIRLRIGSPIPYEQIEHIQDPEELTSYLRMKTFILSGREDARRQVPVAKTLAKQDPIAAASDQEALKKEIENLPEEQHLVRTGDLEVHYARAEQAPTLLRELGRLREITFRENQEGTGKPLDLDGFDEDYIHLVVWDAKRAAIVGAYRLGPTDEILPKHGKRGLYCTTLFKISRKLLEKIGPALEMGRSFVTPEYQKSYAPLMMLWKGIGRFVVLHPRYRVLFGPVSIRNDYNTVSKQLMMAFLKSNEYLSEHSPLVKAKRPPKLVRKIKDWDPRMFSRVVRDVSEVSALVSEIEEDHKGVPILLRQYLKLGSRLLGFNVDPEFGDVVDALILTDLLQTDPKILGKYMGRDGVKTFLAHHRESAAS